MGLLPLLDGAGRAILHANEEPEGIGHCPDVDDPRALARRIVAFARDIAP